MSSCNFELLAIKYTYRRVDHCVKELRYLVRCAVPGSGSDEPMRHQQAAEAWKGLVDLLHRQDNDTPESVTEVVQQAYKCLLLPETHCFLQMRFQTKGGRIWYALKYLARPITDCRTLRAIASRHPSFRDVRILPVPPRCPTTLNPSYQVDIATAWSRLTSTPLPPELTKQHRFKRDCGISQGFHAEMQLFMYYQDHPQLLPTLPYFGCSRKSCLLCGAFLRALPDPIGTRGRLDICYPAWAVPSPRSVGEEAALVQLEQMLISRIEAHVHDPSGLDKMQSTQAVPRSSKTPDGSGRVEATRVRHAHSVKERLKLWVAPTLRAVMTATRRKKAGARE